MTTLISFFNSFLQVSHVMLYYTGGNFNNKLILHGNITQAYGFGVPGVQQGITPFSFSVISSQGFQLHLNDLFHVSSCFSFFLVLCTMLCTSLHAVLYNGAPSVFRKINVISFFSPAPNVTNDEWIVTILSFKKALSSGT